MKVKHWLILALFAAAICWIIVLALRPAKSFSPITFDKTNIIYNKTDRKYLDTIVYVALQELGIEGVVVGIKDVEPDMVLVDYEVKAYLKGNNRQYVIYIADRGKWASVTTVAHELLHLNQYFNGYLNTDNEGYAIWKGKTIYKNDKAYENYPWEEDAFDNQEWFTEVIRARLTRD